MSTTEQSTSNSSKPQIFIKHVDLSITEDDIKQACEQKNAKPTIINIRKNHDQKSNHINLTFASENEAKTLKGTVVVKGIELKFEEYQDYHTPNLFFKNTHSFSEEQLNKEMRNLIKGQFHMTVSHNSVFFYIQDEQELNFLINQSHTFSGKSVQFEKYESLENKYNGQAVISHFTLNEKNPQYGQNPSPATPNSTTFTLVFKEPKVAEEVYQELKDSQKFLEFPITISWKRPENSEEKTVFLKFLLPTVTEKQIQSALSKYGEVYEIEMIAPHPQSTTKTQSAYVLMVSEGSCKNIMEQGVLDENVKKLFSKYRPNISPYISKDEYRKYQEATNKNRQSLPNQATQFMQNFMGIPNASFPNQFIYPPQFQNPQQQQFQSYPQQNQQRKQQYIPNQVPFQQQQFMQYPQQQYANFQQQQGYKKGGHRNNNYQNNNQNQGNYNNNYKQHYNNQHHQGQQHQQQHHHQGQQQQQQQVKNYKLYTKEELHNILQTDPANITKIVFDQTKHVVTQHLNTHAQFKNFTQYALEITNVFTDKENFETKDLIDLIFDVSELSDRINEALELIKEQKQ